MADEVSRETPRARSPEAGPAADDPAPPDGTGLPQALVRGARDREPAALEAFFDHFFPRVYRMLERMVRDRATAEDLVQETFFRIHRAIDRLDPDRDPTPWVTTIAVNVCRKHWASRANQEQRRTVGFEDRPGLDERLPSTAADAGALREERVEHERLRRALARLPEPMREAVVLHVWSGLAHDEIADALGIGHAAARKRYSRALAQLGQLLEDPTT